MKKINWNLVIFTLLLVAAGLLGGYFYFAKIFVSQNNLYGNLKPEVTTTLNARKITKPTASVASAINISDQIFGAKILLPLTVVTTDKGDNLLVLINKKIRLPADYVPKDLVPISEFPTFRLRSEPSQKLSELFTAAKAAGLNLTVVSAYRSYQDQINVFNSWVASAGLKSAETFSARAGFSQHQLGTAVDFGVGGKAIFSGTFSKTLEGVWLTNNSYKFGYILSYPSGKESITGYSYEPWHYRYIGVANAEALVKSGLILEEYLQQFGTW